MQKPTLILSEQDLNRLETMLEHQTQLTATARQLEEELARAEVVKPDQVPNNVVTMNAQVLIRLENEIQPKTITLVYPHDFKGENGQVNVLAPIGAAILGLAEGQEIQWPQPDGHFIKVRIEKVLYQPEREGNFL